MTTDRRSFLKQAAASLAAAGAVGAAGCAPGDRAHAAADRALDPALLSAMGDALLPDSLGAGGRARAVAAFASWLAAYQPVAEEMHGYGDAEINYTPPDPAPGWNAQLDALDALARQTRRGGFVALDVPARRDVLRTALRGVRSGRLPANPLGAPHVAVALLAHWAASSDATDLAYGVRIGTGNCRVLADAPRQPLPIAGSAD